MRDWPIPCCLREVRAFVGLCSYYRRFVRNFATIAEPLTRLTKKGAHFNWSAEAQTAFERWKEALINATILAFPQPDTVYILDCDSSDAAAGAVLSITVNGIERPVAFYSKIYNDSQRNYCTTRRELLSVVSALQHLLGTKVIVRTDHNSLKWLKTFRRPEGILARWLETISEYSILAILHRPGRLHGNADGLSRSQCKQCWGKTAPVAWVDELERADQLTEPLGIRLISLESEISDSEMAQLQKDDPVLQPIIDYLTNDREPCHDELRTLSLESRNLWSQRPTIKLQQDVLVRETDTNTQLVVPFSLRRRLFDNIHSGALAAHLGTLRTLNSLKTQYYWPSMRKDIEFWYKQCPDCATSKTPPLRPKGQLEKVTAGAPMDIVAIDILSGYQQQPTVQNIY